MFENVVVLAAARKRELLIPDRRRLLAEEAMRGMERKHSHVGALALGWIAAGLIGGAWGLPAVAVAGVVAFPIVAWASHQGG